MRLLKTHSHTSKRTDYETMKNAKKLKETQTLKEGKPSVKTCRVPRVWRGGRDDKALWQDQPPSKPSRVSSAWRAGRDEEKRIAGEHRREDKGNQNQNPPAGCHRGRGEGARQEAKTNTKWKGGTTHSPTRGGKCLDENA